MSNGAHTSETPGTFWPSGRIAEPIPLTQPTTNGLTQAEHTARQAAQREVEARQRWGMVEHFTGHALQGLLASVGYNVRPEEVANKAVDIAKAVVSELERRRHL